MNSGCCMPFAHPRSPDIFRAIDSFDYDHWRKKGMARGDVVVEFAADHKIANVRKFLIKHEIL
jgi:hypothetical protein